MNSAELLSIEDGALSPSSGQSDQPVGQEGEDHDEQDPVEQHVVIGKSGQEDL
jgi:hypothetical protein